MTGAEQGAATRPEAAPMMNAPATRPPVPALAARCRMAAGTRTGMTSNMDRAASMSRFAMAKYAQGLAETVPNMVPVRPARRPSPA